MLTDEEFRLFRNLIYDESGIYMKDTRKDFVENRVAKRIKATGLGGPYWYYKYVLERKTTELLILLDLLTVNETSFFRNKPQMDFFRDISLPELATRKAKDNPRRLRIWSAGCSTGEEPYTIAILAREHLPRDWDVKIYASDLSMTALEAANRGQYEQEKIRATVQEPIIRKYFTESGGRLSVKKELKDMVVFDYHNLKNDNGLRNLDVIFCRNVMIYFDMQEQRRLAVKFHEAINPGGYLFIGHAESFQGMSTGFQFVYHNKGTAYKKNQTKEALSNENSTG